MKKRTAFIGLGGNIGDTIQVMRSVLSEIGNLPEIENFKVSPFYKTSPVGCDSPQADYTNAVCQFDTTLEGMDLLNKLEQIETLYGKVPSPKKTLRASRVIDLDLLFLGTERHNTPELEIPHPRWFERLFVLVPLADLIDTIFISNSHNELQQINLVHLIRTFPDTQNQKITPL